MTTYNRMDHVNKWLSQNESKSVLDKVPSIVVEEIVRKIQHELDAKRDMSKITLGSVRQILRALDMKKYMDRDQQILDILTGKKNDSTPETAPLELTKEGELLFRCVECNELIGTDGRQLCGKSFCRNSGTLLVTPSSSDPSLEQST